MNDVAAFQRGFSMSATEYIRTDDTRRRRLHAQFFRSDNDVDGGYVDGG